MDSPSCERPQVTILLSPQTQTHGEEEQTDKRRDVEVELEVLQDQDCHYEHVSPETRTQFPLNTLELLICLPGYSSGSCPELQRANGGLARASTGLTMRWLAGPANRLTGVWANPSTSELSITKREIICHRVDPGCCKCPVCTISALTSSPTC